MNTFSNIKELLRTLSREQELLSEMLEKRKTFSYKYDYALEMVDDDDGRIKYLLERGVTSFEIKLECNTFGLKFGMLFG